MPKNVQVSLLLLSTYVALHITAQQPSLPVSFKWQNVTQCYGGMEPTSERLNECQCAPGRIFSNSGIPQGRNDCAACEKDHAVSSDLAFCVKCLTSDGSLLSPDINTGKCPPCAGGQEIAQLNWHKLNGSGLIFEQCTRCPDGTTPNGTGDKCVPCQSATCMCEKNSSLPFCIDLATDAYQIPLLLIDGANVAAGFASDYIKLHLRDAELACKRADRRQCAHLANLCTLQDYARTSGGACNALENARVSLQQTTSQQSIVPQLFYANIDASMEIFRDTAIDAIYELVEQRRNSRLDIVAMAFSTNGTFLGQTSFDNQKCAWILENAGTEFFELYMRFEDTNGETKRFYVVDRQSAADQSLKNASNQLVRSPDRITLHIHLQPNQEGRIFVPYLQISHVQIQQHQGQNNSSSSSSSTFSRPDTFLVEFEFRISYHADSYPYDKTVEVVMATTCSIAAVWAAIRAYSWGRRSADGIGNVFLLVMSIIAVWLTFAYKLQSHLFYVPLADVQEGSFVAYLVSATALKALSLAHTLISLTLIQTFFIDWERPRTLSTQKQPIDNSKVEDKTAQNSVVIWRTYLIANEWNELQLYRKTRLSVQLLTALFLLDCMEFGNFAKLQPGFARLGQPSEIVETRMSRFAVDISFYFGIEMAQWLVQLVVVERLVDPFRNFMDLCSVANISVLAMTNPLRGFYIHGRSVHGFADTDMLQMNVFLQRERDNLCAMRGLEMGSDLQTFVVNVPRAFREKIDQIMATAGTNGTAIARQSTNTLDKTTLHMHQIAMAYNELNEYFKDFVNRVDPQCDYVLTSPRLVEALLGLELTDTSGVGTFRRDPSECEYSSAFLYGNEWALMSFEMLLFCLVDLWWRSRLLAAFVTYLLSTGIGHMVKLYFTHQLAKSSMVDSRFLI
uniref:Meckelin n=1 Tax=Globodera rostochiensis TaxID=31243 RepID=A0A914I2N3_GLORO